MYNKTITGFGFCDIPNNQGLGKCYQPRPSAQLITLTLTLIILVNTKTSSNNIIVYYIFGRFLLRVNKKTQNLFNPSKSQE